MVKRETLEAPKHRVELFLDSGVFSAWNRGKTIDVKEYSAFIKRNQDCITTYATVDVIPGKFRQKRTNVEVEESAKQSYDNQQTMRSLGLKPMPIFHQGEDFKWFERYLKDGEGYIGISTAKDLRNSEHREWLDHVFSMICDNNGRPHVKTHGFGITSTKLLQRYPWYSCDSTTWALSAGYGLCLIPGWKQGKPNFKQNPVRIIMSDREQTSWGFAKRQFNSISLHEQQAVERWLAHCGIELHDAMQTSSARRKSCVKYFQGLVADRGNEPFHHGNERYGHIFARNKSAKEVWPEMRLYYATMLTTSLQFSLILNEADARTRLVSYWELIGCDERLVRKYVEDGIIDLKYRPQQSRPQVTWNEAYSQFRRDKMRERIKAYEQAGLD